MNDIAYVYDAKRNLVRTRAEGVIQATDLLAYVRSILEDETIAPGFVEVVDFEPVEDMVVAYRQMAPFQQIWRRYLSKGVRAVILYAPSEVSYGICRMIQSVADPAADQADGMFSIVRTAGELGARLAELGIDET